MEDLLLQLFIYIVGTHGSFILLYLILLLQLFQICPLGNPLVDLYVPFSLPPSLRDLVVFLIAEHFFTSCFSKCSRLILYISCSTLRISHSPASYSSFYWRIICITKIFIAKLQLHQQLSLGYQNLWMLKYLIPNSIIFAYNQCKSSLDYLQYLILHKCYVKGCYTILFRK